MQIRADQLEAHLARGPAPLYTVHGDEPLLAQEAGDAIRAAARRRLQRTQGLHRQRQPLRLERRAGRGAGDEPVRRTAADRDPHPFGKPGTEGSRGAAALLRAAGRRRCSRDAAPARLPAVKVGLVRGARRRRRQLRVEPVERRALPAWIAQRLARQGQQVAAGEEGQRTLAFFADRVEGNLLAAHQELQKMACCTRPASWLRAGGSGGAGRGALRRLQARRAILAGQVARAAHARRPARRRRGTVLVHWTLAEDIRNLARARAALDAGKPMPLALKRGAPGA